MPAGQNDDKTVVLLHLDEVEGSTTFVNSGEAATNPVDPETEHEDRRDNPHEVTQAQVGLTNVTDDAQLKRAAGDIGTFAEKATPVGADKVLLEDSADSGEKKWAQVQNLPAGGTGAPTDAQYVALAADATLTDERVLTAGDLTAIDDAGAGSTATVRSRCGIFITNLTGAGTITNKTYEANTAPANKILTAAESDDDDVTVALEITGGTDSWQPDDVTVSGAGATPVVVAKQDWTQVGNSRTWTATANLTDADTSDPITATMSDGGTATLTYTRALSPPLVNADAAFDTHAGTTGGDPLVQGAQTETTSVDGTQTVRITGTTEAHATKIWVTNAGVSSTEQGPFDVTAGAFDFTINVRSSGNTGAQTATLEAAVGVGGTRGATRNTNNTVTVSHTEPTFTGGTQSDIAYPGTQEALKDVETCTVTVTHTNAAAGDTYLYDDNSTGELTIPSTTTYSAAKASVARLSGNYRESGTNYRLTATRTAKNGTSTTKTVTVKIAHVLPTIVVTEPNTRLRSRATGGNKTHTITITSDQALKSAPSLSRDAADTPVIALGAFSGGPLVWTATLQVREGDVKNVGAASFTWASLSATNRAEKVQTTVDTAGANDDTYVIGGFEERDVAIAKFTTFDGIGCMATNLDNPNKLACEYVGLGAATYVANTTDDPGSKKFTIVNVSGDFDADGNHVKCNDSNIYDAVDYTMRISEAI